MNICTHADHGRAIGGIFKRTPNDFTQREVRCGTWLWCLGQLQILIYSTIQFCSYMITTRRPMISINRAHACHWEQRTSPPFLYHIRSRWNPIIKSEQIARKLKEAWVRYTQLKAIPCLLIFWSTGIDVEIHWPSSPSLAAHCRVLQAR